MLEICKSGSMSGVWSGAREAPPAYSHHATPRRYRKPTIKLTRYPVSLVLVLLADHLIGWRKTCGRTVHHARAAAPGR